MCFFTFRLPCALNLVDVERSQSLTRYQAVQPDVHALCHVHATVTRLWTLWWRRRWALWRRRRTPLSPLHLRRAAEAGRNSFPSVLNLGSSYDSSALVRLSS